MRVERVVASAFGPFHGETLELAPGMTVVSGPNEAGKSSWHAALRAALCGLRRGRGRPGGADAVFADLHRPWDSPEPWEVEARLVLDDGRRIEIRQDLSGRIDSRAVDRDLGRDVSAEIIHEGSPDASRWLGLTRESFTRTICVDQAEILAVTADAAALQEQLQRAAATRGTDATAAEALARLRAFRADAVGTERAHTKPLMVARVEADRARAAFVEATRAHADYLALTERLEAARAAAECAGDALLQAEAALAGREAADLERRAARAQELTDRHPAEPAGLPARDELADAIAAAIDGWQHRPEVPALDGESAAELRTLLAALPAEPEGDLAPAPDVLEARNAWAAAREAEALLETAPQVPPLPETGGLEETDLRRIAADLAAAPGISAAGGSGVAVIAGSGSAAAAGSGGAAAAAPGASPRPGRPTRRLGVPALGAALACAVLAALAFAGGAGQGGLALAGAAAVLALVGLGAVLSGAAGAAPAGPRVAVPGPALQAADGRWRAAAARVAGAGLEPRPETLEALAGELSAYRSAARERARWEERSARARERILVAAADLGAALGARGIAAGHDLAGAVAAYEAACRARAHQHLQAARGPVLRQALASREEAEEAARHAARRAAEAEGALRDAGARIGADPGTAPDELVAALRRSQASRAEAARAHETALREWQELRGLLGDGTLDALHASAAEARRRAGRLARGRDAAAVDGSLEADPAEQVARLRTDAAAAARAADELSGEAASASARLPSVPERQEALERAAAEVARLERLGATVDRTIELLTAAQERVHRDLAPVLADAIRPDLPAVTGGRYVDVAVDPATLLVRIKESAAAGGHWRGGDVVSRGTREQVYLLLRAAMAQYLVTTRESAPLLLDEVTAQSDDARATALLDTLHRISADRQVVLFSHDPTVAAWAGTHLGPGDRLVELPVPG